MEFYPSAEEQSVYSTAPADWVICSLIWSNSYQISVLHQGRYTEFDPHCEPYGHNPVIRLI